MSGELAGRRALVCGASAGIGRACALALASAGAEVTVLARSRDRLAALVPELEAAGAPRAAFLAADLDRREETRRAVEELLEADGSFHILVNNAGGPPSGLLSEAREEDFLTAFGRHVLSSQVLVRALLPGMAAAGYGRILNIVSTSVREPIPGLGVSNTIRGAVASWAKSWSRELPPGVTINNVLPGFTDTDRLRALKEQVAARRACTPGEVLEAWLAEVPEGRLGRPEEIAALVAFLAGPRAGYIRGQSIAVDGGRTRGI